MTTLYFLFFSFSLSPLRFLSPFFLLLFLFCVYFSPLLSLLSFSFSLSISTFFSLLFLLYVYLYSFFLLLFLFSVSHSLFRYSFSLSFTSLLLFLPLSLFLSLLFLFSLLLSLIFILFPFKNSILSSFYFASLNQHFDFQNFHNPILQTFGGIHDKITLNR